MIRTDVTEFYSKKTHIYVYIYIDCPRCVIVHLAMTFVLVMFNQLLSLEPIVFLYLFLVWGLSAWKVAGTTISTIANTAIKKCPYAQNIIRQI